MAIIISMLSNLGLIWVIIQHILILYLCLLPALDQLEVTSENGKKV